MNLIFLFMIWFQLFQIDGYNSNVYLRIEPQFELERFSPPKFNITLCGFDFSYPRDRYLQANRIDDDFGHDEIKITLREVEFENPCNEQNHFIQSRFCWSAHLIGDDGEIHGAVSIAGHVDTAGIIFTSTGTCCRFKNGKPVTDENGNVIEEIMDSIGNLDWRQFSKDLLIETAMLNAFKYFKPMKEFTMPLPEGFNEWELENYERKYPDDFVRIPAKNMTMEECKQLYKKHGHYLEEWDDDLYEELAKDANKRGELVFGAKSLNSSKGSSKLHKLPNGGIFSNMSIGSKIQITIGDLARSPELREQFGFTMEDLRKMYDENRRREREQQT